MNTDPPSTAIDWWMYGVLLYEMLLGQAPFKGDDEDEMFEAILSDEPLFPLNMPHDAVSLLQAVCLVHQTITVSERGY